MTRKTIVFDLDDTLALEIDFLHSAFREIAQSVDPHNPNLFDFLLDAYTRKDNPFARLVALYPENTVVDLLYRYRNHYPVYPKNRCKQLLEKLKENSCVLGLITDGYSITQRNKLKALGIEQLFDLLIISEEFGSSKPNLANFEVFHQFASDQYYYIGDNPAKDFIAPNTLGWTTICLVDGGKNIHPQNFSKDSLYLPHKKIEQLSDLVSLLDY